MATDWTAIVGRLGNTQYQDRIKVLQDKNLDTSAIETTVKQTVNNLRHNNARSFLIFGEP